MKPLGRKSYGSIPHLSSSKLWPGDYHCHAGQERIATVKSRDKNDIIIVQEKLDGGNVGICKVNGEILAITRAGYLAHTSPFETHWIFEKWVMQNERRFDELLNEGERVCGEWLYHAVGTRYNLPHEPFVGFDLMIADKRKSYFEVKERLEKMDFVLPNTISIGAPLSIILALQLLGSGGHGAIDQVEGLMYRVERKSEVDFLCKYVRPEKENGIYFEEKTGQAAIKNGFVDKSINPIRDPGSIKVNKCPRCGYMEDPRDEFINRKSTYRQCGSCEQVYYTDIDYTQPPLTE